MHAREILICIGEPAVPAMIDTLADDSSQVCWQAIKGLESIRDLPVATAHVQWLKDENAGVCWSAADALFRPKRAASPALPDALTG